MSKLKLAGLAIALSLTSVSPARADLPSKAAGEVAEFVIKKFGRKVAAEGTEALTRKITAAAARHGDDVLAAIRKVGPKALGLVDDAGENAPRVARFLSRYGDDGVRVLSHPAGLELFSRYGDEAAEVLIKHQGVAEPLLGSLGEPAVKALGAIGPQGGRRMAMLAGDLTGSGHAPEVMEVIARYGDPAMEFIWKNKAILAGGAALTAFLANPEPYLNGATDLTRVVAENAVQPAVVATGHVAQEAVSLVRWTVAIALVTGIAGLGLAVKSGFFKQPMVRAAMKLAGKQLLAGGIKRK